MNTLRSEIKALATQQVDLKNQRKTVNLIGVSTLPTWKAASMHYFNRRRLRIMYMALGLLRGKTPDQVERNPKEPINMDEVNKLVEIHAAQTIRVNS